MKCLSLLFTFLFRQEYQDTHSSGFIVVREEDIVQGEEIQAVAEEITE